MANKNIEYSKLIAIPGTNLAYIIKPSGVKYQNGFDNRLDYLRRELGWDSKPVPTEAPQTDEMEQVDFLGDIAEDNTSTALQPTIMGEQITLIEEIKPAAETIEEPNKTITLREKEDSKNRRLLRDYCVKIYVRNEGESLEELGERIKNNKAILLEDTFFSAVNQDFRLDDNGNLVLRTFGASLDDVMMRGGDVLVSSDGKVLRDSNGTYFIHAHDEFGNYPIDVFVAKKNSKTNTTDIIRIDHNFLDSNGRLFSKSHFKNTATPAIQAINHTFATDEKNLYIDSSRTINPTAYVYTDKNECKLFPSATALLIANRDRKNFDNLPPYVENETPYIRAHYERAEKIPQAQKKLNKLYADGKISYLAYKRKMAEIDKERDLMHLFETDFETDYDRDILDSILYGDIENESDNNPTNE